MFDKTGEAGRGAKYGKQVVLFQDVGNISFKLSVILEKAPHCYRTLELQTAQNTDDVSLESYEQSTDQSPGRKQDTMAILLSPPGAPTLPS